MDKLENEASILKQYFHVLTELLKISFIKKQTVFNIDHIYDI